MFREATSGVPDDMRILHIADIHLGARNPALGRLALSVGRARFEALARAIAIGSDRADLILVAGDLFDTESPDRDHAVRALQIVSDARVPVAIIPGNHDFLSETGVWTREPWNALPEHVRVFLTSEAVVRPWGLDLVLYTCPLRAREGRHSPVAWIKEARAGSDALASHHVGLAHATTMLAPDMEANEFPIEVAELDSLGLDYLALGHWHTRTAVDDIQTARRAYPGSPQPGKFGDPDGAALLVELTDDGPVAESVATGVYRYVEVGRAIADIEDVTSLGDALVTEPDREHALLRVKLTGSASLEAVEEAMRLKPRLDEAGYAFAEVRVDALVPEPRDIELARLPAGPMRRTVELLVERHRNAVAEEKEAARRAVALAWNMATHQE